MSKLSKKTWVAILIFIAIELIIFGALGYWTGKSQKSGKPNKQSGQKIASANAENQQEEKEKNDAKHRHSPPEKPKRHPVLIAGNSKISTPNEFQLRMDHLPTPEPVRGIYLSSWVAGTPKWRDELIQFVKKSEVNAVVIDVKDSTGYISFDTQNPSIKSLETQQVRIRDIRTLIQTLHANRIYVIARITVFQDPVYVKKFPNLAVHTKAGTVWRDRKGLSYVDPSAKPFWNYIVEIAKTAAEVGFDELNFDYVRFPSDGNLKDISFPISGPQVLLSGRRPNGAKTKKIEASVTKNLAELPTLQAQANPSENIPLVSNKAKALDKFFSYLHQELMPLGIPISADVFGLTTSNFDDLNIGQILEVIAPHFNYVCPMVYPSHYPRGFKGYENPAAHPYEIIHFALMEGTKRLKIAGHAPSKLRPWLQDFNLGAHYDANKIRAQKKATYDSGLTSWMMWDPRNKYTRNGYDLDKLVNNSQVDGQ